jgi:transcriptional regulator with XRE-family HTH domain
MVASKPNTFGARLRRLRLDRGWVQTDLEEASNVGQSVISKFERGEVQYPDPDAIDRLEQALGVSSGELMDLAMADHMHRERNDVPDGSLIIEPGDKDLAELMQVFARLGRKSQSEVRRLADFLLREQEARARRRKSDEGDASSAEALAH